MSSYFTASVARQIAEEAKISETQKRLYDQWWNEVEEILSYQASQKQTTATFSVAQPRINHIVSNLETRGFKIIKLSFDKSNEKYYIMVNFSAKHTYVPEFTSGNLFGMSNDNNGGNNNYGRTRPYSSTTTTR